jgi:hypothetical protein
MLSHDRLFLIFLSFCKQKVGLYLEMYHSILLPNLYLLAIYNYISMSVDVMKYLHLKEHLFHIMNSFGSGEFVRFAENLREDSFFFSKDVEFCKANACVRINVSGGPSY